MFDVRCHQHGEHALLPRCRELGAFERVDRHNQTPRSRGVIEGYSRLPRTIVRDSCGSIAATAYCWHPDRQDGGASAEGKRHRRVFVRTVRGECLDWLLILNRRHLERVLRVYVEHYNTQRPHRAARPPAPATRGTTADTNHRRDPPPRPPRRPDPRVLPRCRLKCDATIGARHARSPGDHEGAVREDRRELRR
ncbi:MAG: integrase core domain-containing protein [Nocardioides sp.]